MQCNFSKEFAGVISLLTQCIFVLLKIIPWYLIDLCVANILFIWDASIMKSALDAFAGKSVIKLCNYELNYLKKLGFHYKAVR